MSGRVVWAGSSSVDIGMELEQVGSTCGHPPTVPAAPSRRALMWLPQVFRLAAANAPATQTSLPPCLQAGQLQLTALFTFVARDMLTNRPHPISPLHPKTRQVGVGPHPSLLPQPGACCLF